MMRTFDMRKIKNREKSEPDALGTILNKRIIQDGDDQYGLKKHTAP